MLRWMDDGRGNIMNELYKAIDELRRNMMDEDERYFYCLRTNRQQMRRNQESDGKGITAQWNGHYFFSCRIRCAKGFLEAFQYTFTVLVEDAMH